MPYSNYNSRLFSSEICDIQEWRYWLAAKISRFDAVRFLFVEIFQVQSLCQKAEDYKKYKANVRADIAAITQEMLENVIQNAEEKTFCIQNKGRHLIDVVFGKWLTEIVKKSFWQ